MHENGLAQGLARASRATADKRPLLILTGHDHKQHIDRYGNVLVIDAGTVGAGGSSGSARSRSGWRSCTSPPDKRSRAPST